jgi:hypothetical protein
MTKHPTHRQPPTDETDDPEQTYPPTNPDNPDYPDDLDGPNDENDPTNGPDDCEHDDEGDPAMWPEVTDLTASTLGASGEDRQRIQVGVTPATIRTLRAALDARVIPDTYVTDGAPVAIQAVSGAGGPTAGDENVPLPLAVTPLRPALLAALLAEHTTVVRLELDKERNDFIDVETSPTDSTLARVLAGRSWPGLPPLRGMIGTPVLRPDGTLLQRPGYDRATGLYLASTVHLPPVPDRPTPAQVEEAKTFLLGSFLRDFPWRTPADRANYLALLATPILRPFTRCLSPFGIVDATMPASGKTILTACLGMLSGQRVLTWTDSEEELRKAITTVLGDQAGVIVFDNLPEGSVIDSAVLARLVTERTWRPAAR